MLFPFRPQTVFCCLQLTDAIKEVNDDLKADKVAKVESPKAFIKLLPIFRQASRDQIKLALESNTDIL